MVELYLAAAAVASAGAIWFFIVRPMLEDWGLIAPRAEEESVKGSSAPVRYVELGNERSEGDRSDRDPSVRIAQDADSWEGDFSSDTPPNLTERSEPIPWRDAVRELAACEMLDDDGRRYRPTVRGIAQCVGKRQEEVAPLVRAVRGSAPVRFPTLTAHGRPVASMLRRRARA